MASVKSAVAISKIRTGLSSLRRIKSHEPGQRVMTEAIALLFSYYAPKDCIPPMPEEFFDYLRYLRQQTYNILVPGPRRKISSKLLGSISNVAPFSNHYDLLDSIEPLSKTNNNLINSIVQAHAIGMRALTTYTALVQDDSNSNFKTHIAEPFIWYTNQLYHDLICLNEKGLGLSLTFIKNGVEKISENGKIRLAVIYDNYDKYFSCYGIDSLFILVNYLILRLGG